jgi:hypothetical protein
MPGARASAARKSAVVVERLFSFQGHWSWFMSMTDPPGGLLMAAEDM